MTGKILLAGDVDAIKEFVFETSSLPQIRGGSELLLECEEEIRGRLQKKHSYQVIYCGGGSFLLKAPRESVVEIKQAIERPYLDKTRVATITIVSEDSLPAQTTTASADGWAGRIWKASQDAVAAGEFSRRVSALGARMRAAKTQKSCAPFYEAFPFGRRCDRCGKRMAAYADPLEPDKQLCSVCQIRDSKGRRRDRQEVRGKFNQNFWEQCSGKGYQAEQPVDLDTLVREARRGYLAFLYADGNDIGRLLQKVRSEEEYQALSASLAQGTEQAVYGALQTVCYQALRRNETWPFDIVNIGGDDVTLLIQAGYAWAVAVEFLERFEQEVNERVQKALGGSLPKGWAKITASCGIAIADVKYPIRYLERLATDLLKKAKKVAKADRDNPVSALNFLWLPTPVASESADPLLAYYSRHPAGDLPMELTARPYTLEQARQLLGSVQKIAQWPRTLRHHWAEALERGVMVSVNAIHYDIARRSQEKREAMYQTLAQVGKMAAGGSISTEIPAPIWYQSTEGGKTVWRTALLDALELAELQAMRPDVEEEAE